LARIIGQRQTAGPLLHPLDGRTLDGADDAAMLHLPDGPYPDTQTQTLIADRFVDIAFSLVGRCRNAASLAARTCFESQPDARAEARAVKVPVVGRGGAVGRSC
jgi:hypothetical protein